MRATHKVKLDQNKLSEEAFKELVGHDAQVKYIVIASVVIDSKYQGQGMESRLLTDFIKYMRALNKAEIHLTCQTKLVTLYEKHSFVYLGESNSDHGGLN